LFCNARAIAKPSAEERIPFQGYTNRHSALSFVCRVCRCCIAASVLSGAGPLEASAAATLTLGEPASCVAEVSARAWRESL
jgi:hypothetical protein